MLIQIILFILIIINIALAGALFMGLSFHTDSTCIEDIKDIKHNKIVAKAITVTNVILSLILLCLI